MTPVDKILGRLTGVRWPEALSALAVGAILVATLWPFNPSPRNRVRHLAKTNGLKFETLSLVTSGEPLKLPPVDGPESYTIELVLRPASIWTAPTILAFYNPARQNQFLVRQYFRGLVITHNSRVENDQTGTISVYFGPIFSPGTPIFLALSSGPNGTTVFVNGQPVHSFPRFEIAHDDLSGQVLLGTSPMQYQPWAGEIRGFALYAKAISPQEALEHFQQWAQPNGRPDLSAALGHFNFAEKSGTELHNDVGSEPDLTIPPIFSVLHKPFLQSPADEFRPTWHYARDLLSNIAGFVPLGVVVCSYLAWSRAPWSAVLATTMFCGVFSLTIEVVQYYIPQRGSGITDIITNTLGGLLGAVLVHNSLVRCGLERLKLLPESQRSTQEDRE